ncbi:MAG: hypothetical protein IKO48_05525 [Elusimicrobia bacterium]|nr:hypothetical protein [Elusimicrobiota bacterium]
MKYLLMFITIFFMSSCTVLDYPKKAAGYSIKNFETEQDGRFSLDCDLEPRKAYNKCNLFLFENNIQTNFKSDKKFYIVASKFTLIYEYTLDSTEVAFFVYETQDNKSKIDVVSNNSRLAKFVYGKLTAYMQK